MDIDNIFELFSDSEFIKDDETPIDFSKTPIYWVGMYKKIVLNHINFNKKVLKFFKKANHEFDIDDIKEAGEFFVYNRAWHYIEKINIEEETHLLALSEYSDEYLDTSLKLGINFYEQQEQYEKCAFLKKILDKTQEFIS
tara:strand:- start:390 stop:809 length:420 start_codon:yes stop_codon:yes gene_type:complete